MLQTHPELYANVVVDVGGYGIIWKDAPFDGLMAFGDATLLWGLDENTLCKAIAYGKLVSGVDACKYGKQWVISTDAMVREYGLPKQS